MTPTAEAARNDLIRPGVLTAAVNLANILLVTGTAADGSPEGVSPGMAAALAERLGVEVDYRTYATPGEVADAAARGEWDIGLIAEDPARAEVIDFCDAYVEIEATYLVPADSSLQAIADVDRPGIRIAVCERAAYDLYLSRALRHAELHRARGLDGAFRLFADAGLDALAGIKPALLENAEKLLGSRVLPGNYTTVRQAIATRPGCDSLNACARDFIAEARRTGLIETLIERHGVAGKLEVVR